MRIFRTLLAAAVVAALCLTAAPAPATAQGGTFSVLSYNIAGLPGFLHDGDPETNTPIIGSRLGPYDIVHVQEDFNYHAALYAADPHPHRTPTSGGVPFGDGLNTLSHLPFEDFQRVTWNDCSSGSGDCLTPKGFTYMRARLAEGVWVDLYNLHTDAGVEPGDLAARRSNLNQLSAFIRTRSAGNAVIVFGDTNTRYTREGDEIAEFAAANGLTDPWPKLVRGGSAPAKGADAILCNDTTVDNTCEVVDKILYRSGGYVELEATAYSNEHARFRNGSGENLSDHYPIMSRFAWSTDAAFRMSDQVGGPHGTPFSDIGALRGGEHATELHLRAGNRVDRIGLTLDGGAVLAHGGNGGTAASLTLASGEYPVALRVCTGKHDNRTRVFFAQFTTSMGRMLSGGTPTGDCSTFTAPSGWRIAGFHGRAGDEVDKIGVVYMRE